MKLKEHVRRDERLKAVLPELEKALEPCQNWADFFDLPSTIFEPVQDVMADINLTRSEREKLFDPIPDVMTAIRQTVERMGDEVFATWIETGDREAGHHTFRQTWESAGAIAYNLVNNWGVKPGDRVILCYNFSFEYFYAFLGCLRAGAIACPVYPIDPSKMEVALTKFKLVVEDTGANIVLTDKLINRVRIGCQVFYGHLLPKHLQWKTTDQLINQRGLAFDNPNRKMSDIAFLQYTSGSTGDPKGVMISFANLGANVGLISGAQRHAFNYADVFPDMTADPNGSKWYQRSRSVSWLPMYHDMGLVYGVVTPFLMGARMYYMSPITFLKDPCCWIRLLSKYKCTWSAGPDFAYRLCAKKWDAAAWPPSMYSMDTLMYMHTGAEPIRQSTLVEFKAVFRPYGLSRLALSPCYGLAESVVCVSWFDPIACYDSQLFSKNTPGYICCAGQFRVDLRIVDPETCEELPDGSPGELWISCPSIAQGYWRKPEVSEQTFRAKLKSSNPDRPWAKYGNGLYLRTGDMAFIEEDRMYYFGRIKDMIIVRGSNFYAQDVEFPAQEAWDAIRGGCIAAFSSEVPGMDEEQLEVVFEVANGKYLPYVFQDNFQKVSDAIAKRTGLVPYRMVAVRDRTIPKTTSGKIRRRATKEALHKGELQVLYDSLGLLGPHSTKKPRPQLDRQASSDVGPSPLSMLKRQDSENSPYGSSSRLASIFGGLFNVITDPVGTLGAIDGEMFTGLSDEESVSRTGSPVTDEPQAEWASSNGTHAMSSSSVASSASTTPLSLPPRGGARNTSLRRKSDWRELPVADGGGLTIENPPLVPSTELVSTPVTSSATDPMSKGTGSEGKLSPSSASAASGSDVRVTVEDHTAATHAHAHGHGGGEVERDRDAGKEKGKNGPAANVSINLEELTKLSARHREAVIVEAIVGVCRSVGVDREDLSGETDMINLGLSSVKAAQLIGQLEASFGVQNSLSEVVLYECATIQDVAQLINTRFFPTSDPHTLNGILPLLHRTSKLLFSTATQAISLAYVGALLAVSLVLPFQLCVWLTSSISVAAGLVVIPVAYMLHVLCLLALTATTKWTVIGSYKPGTYSTEGLYFLRWHFVDRVVAFTSRIAVAPIRGSMLHTLWLKVMGVRGHGLPAAVHTEFVSEFDLVELGSGVTIETGARVRGAVVENGFLYLGSVHVGKDSTIGAQSCIQPGARIEASAVVGACTVLSARTGAVTSGTLWSGSPAKFVRNLQDKYATSSEDFTCAGARDALSVMARVLVPLAGLGIAAFALIGSGLVSALVLAKVLASTGVSMSFTDSWTVLCGPLLAVFGPLALPFVPAILNTFFEPSVALSIARDYYVLGVGIPLGLIYCLFGIIVTTSAAILTRTAARLRRSGSSCGCVWAVEMCDVAVRVLHDRLPVLLGGTIGYAWYLQALGADVHRDAHVASEFGIEFPEHLSVAAHAFVHPSVVLQTGREGREGEGLKGVSLGTGAVVGEHATVSLGASLEKESTLAPLSPVEEGRKVYTGTTKTGYATVLRLKHPPINPDAHTSMHAHAQSSCAIDALAFTVFRYLYPLVAITGMGCLVYVSSYPAFLLMLVLAPPGSPIWLPAVLIAPLFVVFGMGLLATAIAIKYLVVQTYTPTKVPLGGLYYHRHHFVSTYIRLVDRLFGSLLLGSRIYNAYLRMLGATVGAEAIVLTPSIEAPDLVHIGERTCVGRDASLCAVKVDAGPCASKNVLDFKPVSVGHECTIGDMAVAMATADVRDLSVAAAGTLLTPEIMVGKRVMVEGNLPYRVGRSNSGSNLLTKSAPFNSPHAMLAVDMDLGADCAFFNHINDAAAVGHSNGNAHSGTIFITGANGFVGRHLVHELLELGYNLCCLVRGRRGQTARDRLLSVLPPLTKDADKRLRVVDGDVSKPQLGLSPATYEALAGEVGVVFHCATVLGFAAPYSHLRDANVTGTKHALEFAARRRVKRFNHVSSILAVSLDMANPHGKITEVSPLGDATRFPVIGASEWTHGYGLSKWVQEVLVRQAARAGLPATVTRLGEVGPHSVTGFMEEGVLVDLFQDTLRTAIVPEVLGTINITPVDYCARGILKVGLEEWGVGRTYHLLDPRFECSSETIIALLEDLGYSIQRTDFLTWRKRMKQADVRKSWFIAGVLSGEQQLVGQNFDCMDGGHILTSMEHADVNGALLLRRFAQHKKLGAEGVRIDIHA